MNSKNIIDSIKQSGGLQIGLPNNLFYYYIPNDFETVFKSDNERLKEKSIFVNKKQVEVEGFQVFAKGEPMTSDDEPQLLLIDSDYKIYYCYSLAANSLDLKIAFNSVKDCLFPIEETIKKLDNKEFLTINIKQKKLSKIINLKEIVKFDIVELEKDITLLNKLVIQLFKLKKINIEKFNIKNNNNETPIDIPSLIEELNGTLATANSEFKLSIIHEIKWDQTFGIGLFNKNEIKKLKDNFFSLN